MSSLRLAFVTRRFWPLAGSEETAMSNLAVECQRQGASVQILTAQWHTSWPLDAVYREVSITRLRKPPQIGWGMLRYMMTLSRWLRQHEQEIDLVYVSHLQHEAHAAVGALCAFARSGDSCARGNRPGWRLPLARTSSLRFADSSSVPPSGRDHCPQSGNVDGTRDRQLCRKPLLPDFARRRSLSPRDPQQRSRSGDALWPRRIRT